MQESPQPAKGRGLARDWQLTTTEYIVKRSSLFLSALLAFGCNAQVFTITNQASGSTIFKLVEIKPDGTKYFTAISTFKHMPGTSTDIYAVKCSSKFVAVQWGDSRGGMNGIFIPGGGYSIITNHDDKAKILFNACKAGIGRSP